MKDLKGNLFGYYPMVKAFINNLKTGNQGPIAKNGLPLFQKVQNKYLKRKWRIRQDYTAGLYDRKGLRFELKEAQCVLMCNFCEANDVVLKRLEKSQHNTENV